MLATTLQAAIDFQRAGAQTDFRAELTKLAVPTLIIHGDADASAPLPLTGIPTAALVPGSRLVIYENAPHGLYLTHREQVNRTLLAFIEGVDAPLWPQSKANNTLPLRFGAAAWSNALR